MGRKKVDSEIRFWSKVSKGEYCWLWTAAKDKDGYGIFENSRAHRYRFIYDNGFSPPIVRHLCDMPSCVRPKHLLAGDAYSNMRDLAERGNNPMWSKTKCPRGHAYEGNNTIFVEKGGRRCRKCTNALWNIRHHKIEFESEQERNDYIG
jgi:hypothetical protein